MKVKLTDQEKLQRADLRRSILEAHKEAIRINGEMNQKPIKEMTITIEWHRSPMWGSNPSAEVSVNFHNGEYVHGGPYRASGCGYDKESTVIAEAFNEFLKYKLYGKLSDEKKYHRNGEKHETPYGVVMDDYRHYSGGIGTSCYYEISKYIGGKFERIASGKSFDVYKYTDGE